MKNYFLILAVAVFALLACTHGAAGQNDALLEPTAFEQKLKNTPNAQLVDVRTPQEFGGKRIDGALNIDYNASDFEAKSALLDKTKPIFVYCYVGGRSANAAEALRAKGYKEVYELKGGIMAWEKENKSMKTGSAATTAALTNEAFDQILKSDQPVLIDFYAPWCISCRKMAPMIEKLTPEFEGKAKIVKIEADANPALVKRFDIKAMPCLIIFKNGQPVWRKEGFADEETMRAALKAAL